MLFCKIKMRLICLIRYRRVGLRPMITLTSAVVFYGIRLHGFPLRLVTAMYRSHSTFAMC